jgi:hypothetical protein
LGEEKAPPAGSAFSEKSAGCCNSENSPPRPNPQDKFRNPRAVREAKRLLKLEFLHEAAGSIRVHAELTQAFAEIGDAAGACYSLKCLFAYARAAHGVYLELRAEAASNDGRPS